MTSEGGMRRWARDTSLAAVALIIISCTAATPPETTIPATRGRADSPAPTNPAPERIAFDPLKVIPGPIKAVVAECFGEKAGRDAWERFLRERTANAVEQEMVRWCAEVAKVSLGDREQPRLAAAPPDQAIERAVGPVVVSTWNPVSLTPLEGEADLYFTVRNESGQVATVDIDGTAAQRAANDKWNNRLIAKYELVGGRDPFFVFAPIRLEPGRSTTVQVRVPFGAIEEPSEVALPFTFRVEETGDEGTIAIDFRARPNDVFTAFAKTSHIAGRVSTPDGRPIANAVVHLWVGTSQGVATIRTWVDGTFSLPVPSGADVRTILGPRPRIWPKSVMTYSVSVSHPGYAYGYRSGIDPVAGGRAQIDFVLQPLPPVNYKLVGEFRTNGPIGFWWVRLAGSGDLVIATEARHPPPIRVPAHVYALDLEGRERWSVPTGAECWGLDVSSDGQLIAAGCADSHVYVITATGLLLRKIHGQFGELPFQPRFSPDGRLLLVDTERGPALIDPRSGDVRAIIPRVGDQIRQARWSADGRRLVVSDGGGVLTTVDADGRVLWRIYLGHFAFPLSIDDHYNVYAGAKSGVYYAFDAQGNERWEWGFSSYHGPRQMPADGRFVVLTPAMKKTVQMLDSSGHLVWDHRLSPRTDLPTSGDGRLGPSVGGTNAIDMTADGSLIVVGFQDYEVDLLDAEGNVLWTDRETPRPELRATISQVNPGTQGVAISPDGRYIVAGYQDSVIRIFERQ